MAVPERLLALLACPDCRGRLTGGPGKLWCPSCSRDFPVRDGVPFLLTPEGAAQARAVLGTDGAAHNRDRRRGEGVFWTIVRLASGIVSSEYAPLRRKLHGPFLELAARGGAVVEIGSGGRRLHPAVVTLDFDPDARPDVVASAERLPFADNSIDGILLEVCLEHVRNASGAACEAVRVLKPGGRVFVVMPFLFPFHGWPADYWRASSPGLREMFASLEVLDEGPYHGQASMILNLATDVAAGGLFPSQGKAYLVMKGLLLAPVFWLKFADALLNLLPSARKYASTLFLVARKPG